MWLSFGRKEPGKNIPRYSRFVEQQLSYGFRVHLALVIFYIGLALESIYEISNWILYGELVPEAGISGAPSAAL